ncbi:MAG: glycine zipper 2TM domain-containing protein [Roseococcus sp.]|nr:glycine zipper 2TM domain-containing protein [Roseococcus sp.]
MRKKAGFLVCLAASGLFLAGCEGQNQQALATGIGTAAGGVAGALIGRQVGGRNSSGALIGGIIGAAVGGVAGNLIGQRLSEAERQRQVAANQRVLEAPVRPDAPLPREQWVSPENPSTRGTTEVLRVTDGGQCRNIREIAYIRGQEVRQETRICRDSNGQWPRQT